LNLTERVLKGVSWNTASRLLRQVFHIGIMVILARLLSPKDFGLIGLAGAFTWFIPIFRDIGLNTAIVQSQELDNLKLSSVFWVQLLLSIFCTIITIILSPFAAIFFNERRLRSIVIAISFGFTLIGLGALHEALLVKYLRFKAIAIRDIFADLAGGVSGVVFAFLGFGVWALVIQMNSSLLVRAILLWKLEKWRPYLKLSLKKIKPLIEFGLFKTLQRFIFVIKAKLDYFLIGKFLGAEALGYYMIAFNFTRKPISQISMAILDVTFPALSQLQKEPSRFRSAYLRIIKYISMMAFPAFTGILIMAPEIVLTLYGKKWEITIPLIRVLSIWGIMNMIAQPAGSVFFALGRAKMASKWEFAQAVIMISIISIGVKWGILGICWSWVISWIIIFPINQYIANRLLNMNFIELARNSKLGAQMTVCMIGVVSLLKFILNNLATGTDKFVVLAICVISGITIYLLMYILMEERSEIHRAKTYILSIIK